MNFFQSSYGNSSDTLPYLSGERYTHTKYKFEQGGLLVYDIKANTINSSIIPQNSPTNATPVQLESTYTLETPNDNQTLVFNSKFECGNLLKAIKLSDYEYDLYLKSDSGSPDHIHWYYFSVYNPRKTSISFTIKNMKKPDPLYELGMKPSVWSCTSNLLESLKWHRAGTNISYTQVLANSYTLKFTYNFKYEQDTVYFAYAEPYTYTDLCVYLEDLSYKYADILRINKLCETINKTQCEYITITDNIADYLDHDTELKEIYEMAKYVYKNKRSFKKAKKKLNNKHANKHGIVLMARVHSGETVSSFMVQGAVEFLVSSCDEAAKIRKHFVFKVIPMLNPDGVRAGNYRCCLNGSDLNRKWLKPNKIKYPTIYYAKLLILALDTRHEIKMICDFHGHTKKKNAFMYGCSIKPDTNEDMRNNLLARIAPYYLHLHNTHFSFKSSHYRVEKYKESTSRIVFFRLLQTPHSYTLESSFYGPDTSNSHFTSTDLGRIGKDLCKFCIVFCNTSLYLKIIWLTNAYLQKSKLGTTKTLDKNSVEEFYDESIEEVSTDRAEQGAIDKSIPGRFWPNVEITECLPDAESSGSDSEIYEDLQIADFLPNTIDQDLIKPVSEKPSKIISRPRLVQKKINPRPKNQSVEPLPTKKPSDLSNLQSYKVPIDVYKKNLKTHDPTNLSNNYISNKTYFRSISTGKKSSLSFLPVLVTFNKTSYQNKVKNSFQSFQGVSQVVAKYNSLKSHFQANC